MIRERISRPVAVGHRRHRIGRRRGAVHPAGLRHGAGLHLRHEGRLSLRPRDVRRAGRVHGRGTSSARSPTSEGHSLQYFTTHYDLVRRQAEARKTAKAQRLQGRRPAGQDRPRMARRRFRAADRCLGRVNGPAASRRSGIWRQPARLRRASVRVAASARGPAHRRTRPSRTCTWPRTVTTSARPWIGQPSKAL